MVSSVSSSLLASYQGQAALALFGSSSSSTGSSGSAMDLAIANLTAESNGLASALSSYYQSLPGGGATAATTGPTAPTAPWNASSGTPSVSTAVQNALDGSSFVNPSAATLDAPAGTSATDYKNLFAVYQGLNTLADLAQTASTTPASGASSPSLAQLQTAFNSGLSQVDSFLNSDPFSGFNVTSGKVSTSEQSSVGIPNGVGHTYTTGVIATGDRDAVMPALQGQVQFTIAVTNTYSNTTQNVNIDLSGMGSTSRTLDNVVGYINNQLNAAGVQTRFSVASLGNATTTSLVEGQTTTTTGAAQWGLTVNGVTGEQVSFSAPSTAAAVYVSEATGGAKTLSSTGGQTTTTTGQTLLGLQTGNNAVGTPPAVTSVSANNTNLPPGGIFSNGLPTGVLSVGASAVAPDGSIYMVASVSGSVSGAPVPGTQGVALLKYDSAGKLLSAKVLGDGTDATGYSLAINTDGSVAVAGSNATPASTAANGAPIAATTTAFVQVFDPTGAPSWSATVPAGHGTSTASGVAFAADGSVYISGTTTGSVGGQTIHGTSDEFIQGYTAAGKATFTTQFGAAGGDNTSAGLVYDSATNSLITAGTENSKAVLRSFALNGTHQPDATATRDLGAVTGLVGIAMDNGQVVVGGNVNAATIHAGTTAQAYKGVGDSFVATVSTDLTDTTDGSVTYMGLSGATETATAMAVAGGQAYLTGTIANDPNTLAYSGATEGFVGAVNEGSGAVTYSKTFSAAGGQAAPSAIAVSATGTSVLDQLGLPQGQLNAAGSTLITANTPIKAGDKFYVRTQPGGPQTAITVTATDTVATLTAKLNTALGGSGAAKVITLGANSQINVTPTNSDSYIELDSQPAAGSGLATLSSGSGTDVLASLGLTSGVIRQVATINSLTDPSQLREYGLNLPSTMDITTQAGAQQALNTLQAAIRAVQQAYQDLASPPTLASEAAAAAQNTGAAPTYLTNEISNLQAGLNRLTGGSSS